MGPKKKKIENKVAGRQRETDLTMLNGGKSPELCCLIW